MIPLNFTLVRMENVMGLKPVGAKIKTSIVRPERTLVVLGRKQKEKLAVEKITTTTIPEK